MTKVHVIVATHNNERFIGDCLYSMVKDETPDKKMIVVDDCSTDGTKAIVRRFSRHWGRISLLESKHRRGFAGNNNLGINLALSDRSVEYIVLLNSDTIVTPAWLNELLKEMDDPEVGIVGPKTLKFDKRTIDTTGHIFHYRLGDAENRGAGEIDRGQYDSKKNVFGVQFSCVLLRRKMMEEIGPLDEGMFLYIEDVDYCVRARLAGWKVVFCPSSLIYHYGGGSGVGKEGWIKRHGLTNRLRLVLKNYGSLRWGVYGFAFCGMAVFTALKNRTFSLIAPYSYAFIWNLLHLPIRERMEIQRMRKYGDSAIAKYNVKGASRWH